MKYKFPCGCEFDVINEEVKSCDGLPSLKIDYYNLPDCPITWDLIKTGLTKGIFQLETNLGHQWAKKLLPNNISEMSALIALMRPGVLKAMVDGKSMASHYCDRKNAIDEVKYFHEALEPILKETYGVLLFQEESMKISQEIAGFTLQEADILRKCVAKGSLVQTQNGPKYIEDLIVNTRNKPKILSTQNGKLKYYPIKKVWSNGEKKVYRISTINGYSIEVTENHQIFTQDGWKKTKDLTNNDSVVIPNRYHYKGYGDININRAIILAYFIGEGCYTERSPLPKITNSEQWVLDLIKRSIINEFGNDSYTESRSIKCSNIYLKNNAKQWIKSVCNKSKSKDKIIPQIILNSTNGTTTAFVGSYFTAEGDVNKQSLCMTSTSKDIIKKLQLLLLRDEIHSSVELHNSTYKKQPYVSYRLCICERNNIAKFYNTYQKYICPRKNKLIENILESNYTTNYKSFSVPKCFIQSVSEVNNINGIVGHTNTTGTIYKNNLTYEKVARLNKLIGSNLLQEILHSEYRFVKIKSIEYVGKKEVFDFELENEPHCGFINGILVHNSIGKKLPEKMAQIKTQFIDGAVKVGKVNKEEAEEIFGWIEKGQRYLFNASHSVSYGKTGYWSAYVKAHFPLHFYTAWLHYAHEKIDPQQEMQKLITDARYFNVEIYPPSLKHLSSHFSIYDKKIYFGLQDIKKIGESLVKQIFNSVQDVEKQLQRTIDKWTWYDFLVFFSDTVSSTAINGIISAGATDYIPGNRVWKVHQYNVWIGLTPKEREWIKSNPQKDLKQSLQSLFNKPRLSKPRKIKIEEFIKNVDKCPFSLNDTAYHIASSEVELLGVSVTCTKLDTCNNQIEANCTCKEFLSGKFGKIVLAVEITGVSEHIIRGGKMKGETMLFLEVEDNTAALDSVIAFPSVIGERRPLFVNGNTVLISGYRDNNNSNTLIINDIIQI